MAVLSLLFKMFIFHCSSSESGSEGDQICDDVSALDQHSHRGLVFRWSQRIQQTVRQRRRVSAGYVGRTSSPRLSQVFSRRQAETLNLTRSVCVFRLGGTLPQYGLLPVFHWHVYLLDSSLPTSQAHLQGENNCASCLNSLDSPFELLKAYIMNSDINLSLIRCSVITEITEIYCLTY